jgi:hypothetical protein
MLSGKSCPKELISMKLVSQKIHAKTENSAPLINPGLKHTCADAIFKMFYIEKI